MVATNAVAIGSGSCLSIPAVATAAVVVVAVIVIAVVMTKVWATSMATCVGVIGRST